MKKKIKASTKTNTQQIPSTPPHTHLHVQEQAFFLKAVGKLRPLNVLLKVVVAVTEGGNDTLPPTGQASSCHVQQMQPKLSKKNHNSRVRACQKWCSLGRITGTTLTCHTTKGRLLRNDLVSHFWRCTVIRNKCFIRAKHRAFVRVVVRQLHWWWLHTK